MIYEFNQYTEVNEALATYRAQRSAIARIKGDVIYVFVPASAALGHHTRELDKSVRPH